MKRIFTLLILAGIASFSFAQTTQRIGVIEDFTSNTCGPCASEHANFDPLLLNNNTNENGGGLIAIKYQMNWPNPGNDPFYNPDGASRRSYYGVNSIPRIFGDGSLMGTNQSAIDAMNSVPAGLELDVDYSISGNDVTVNVTMNPLQDNPSNILKLHIVVVEDFYNYTAGTTSQTNFYHVQRKMLPGVGGTLVGPFTTGNPETVSENYTFTVGGTAQGNHNIYTTMNNLSVVAFVQDAVTKEIFQGGIAAWPTSVNNVEGFNNQVRLFPNPVRNSLNVKLEVEESATANYNIINSLGQVVYTENSENIAAGVQALSFNTSNLSEGLYFLELNIGDKRAVKKFMIEK